MKIAHNCAVQMHYHLTSDSGETIDSSKGRDPLEYLHGHGHIVPGVEMALEGKAKGDNLSIVVPPEDGYGDRDPKLDVAISLTVFPEESRGDLVEGARFRGPLPENQNELATFTVIKVENKQVLCTANHPLAGVTLRFDIEVVDVRQGTKGEVADGQIHSSDCSVGCC
jgi:FKBP-type peptidyl-prolyl cis-trans isomerase SlyD